MLQYFEKAQNFMACTAFLLMNSNSSNTKLERRRNIENINPRRLSLNLVITFLWLNSSMLLYVKLAQFVPFKGLIHRNAGGSWSCSVCCLEWFICWAAAAWWAAVSVSRAVLIVTIAVTLPLTFWKNVRLFLYLANKISVSGFFRRSGTEFKRPDPDPSVNKFMGSK